MRTTVEDILAGLQGILDGAEGRTLTDEEAGRYEGLERDLESARRSEQIRARNSAYNALAPGQHLTHAAPARPDDTLERAYEAYLRTGRPNADISDLAAPTVRNAQGEGSSTGGGYLVPPSFRTKIVEVMKAYGGLAGLVETYSTGDGTPVEYPSLDDTANSGDIVAESAAPSSGADLAFGSVKLGAYKYDSAGASGNPFRVPVELAQDAAFDLGGLIARAIGTRIARKQAAHFETGTGVGQPLGLLAAGLTQNVDLITPDTVVYKDLLNMEDALDPAHEPNAGWIMRKNTWSQIRAIVDTAGRPIVQDSTAGIGDRPQRMLLGYPVTLDQQAPLLSSAGITFPVAFGDFREAYVIRRVSNLAIIVNPYTRMSNGEVEYLGWERADGTVQCRSAYVILRNNT